MQTDTVPAQQHYMHMRREWMPQREEDVSRLAGAVQLIVALSAVLVQQFKFGTDAH